MTAAAAAKPTILEAFSVWLRYDEELVVDVESAYDTFVRQARFGWWIFGAIVAATLAGLFAAALHPGEPNGRVVTEIMPAVVGTFYGVQLLPLLLVPRSVLATMLRGCVDVRRAVLAGVVLGLIGAIVEMLFIVALFAAKSKPPALADPFSSGILFGIFMMLLAAPFVEEFEMQAWLQTRLRPAGGLWAGILTTIVFVLMHLPRTFFEIIRGVSLGFAAILRGTTRSLAACIAVHFTNNAIFGAVLLLALSFGHGHHLPHGSHP